MSSWLRDNSINPPQKPEQIPVLYSPTLTITSPAPVRTFEMPTTKRTTFDSTNPTPNQFWRTVEALPVNPTNEPPSIRTFNYPSRIKFNKTPNLKEQILTPNYLEKSPESVITSDNLEKTPKLVTTETVCNTEVNNTEVNNTQTTNLLSENQIIPTSANQENPQQRTFEYPSRIKFVKGGNKILIQKPSVESADSRAVETGQNSSSQEKTSIRTFDNQMRMKFDPKATKASRKLEPWVRLEQENKKPEPEALPNIPQNERPQNPNVTVIIEDVSNVEFLEGTLLSLTRQTYLNWIGVLVLKSLDNDIVKSVKQALNKMRIGNIIDVQYFNENSSADILTKICEASKTPYISLCRSSDLWVAKKLELQIAELEAKADLGIVGSMARYFGDKIELIKVPPGKITIEDFKRGNPLVYSSVVMRRDMAKFTNAYENYDYDCWLRNFTEKDNITNLPQILTLQRDNNPDVSKLNDMEIIRKKYDI